MNGRTGVEGHTERGIATIDGGEPIRAKVKHESDTGRGPFTLLTGRTELLP